MKYGGTLLSVFDMVKSKDFYTRILEQKIVLDLGVHVSFESGISLQSNYSELVGVNFIEHKQSNNFQLYFEVDDIDLWSEKLKKIDGLEFLHDAKEYSWGQRALRFYDYDKHIIEIAESMENVVKRFLKQGLSVEETAKRTQFPIEFVNQCL